MKKSKLNEYTRGWLIGDFEPNLFRTKEFEVGILTHRKGEVWPKHYHALGTEYNVLIQGRMTIAGEDLVAGDVFVFEPMEIADPIFHEDCTVLCVKVPSIPGDKYEVL